MAEHVVEVENMDIEENKPKIKVGKTVLDNFNLITRANEVDRKKGTVGLMKHLSEYSNIENGQDELKYTLDRIVRGLGSSKITARAGFFAAFVAILSSAKCVTIQQLFELIQKHLHTGKSNSKSENADISAGQILVYGGIVHSKLFKNATFEEQKQILEGLLTAGKKRAYLGLASYTFIIDLFADLDSNTFKLVVLPVLKPEIAKPLSEQSLDSVYTLLQAHKKYPEILTAKFLKKTIGFSSIISEETLQPLCELLLNIPVMTLKHPICEIIAKEVATSSYLETFVENLDRLISKPNENKHIITASILKNILQNLEDYSHIPALLTKNFLQHTISYYKNNIKSKKDHVQQSIVQLFDAIVEVLKKPEVKSKVQISVLKKLLFYPGVFNFEQITKMKIVQQIIAILSPEGVKKLSKIFSEVVLASKDRQRDEENFETWWNVDRLYGAQMLAKLIGHPSVQADLEYKTEYLTFFIDVSIIRKEEYQNIGCELAAQLKTTFYRALDQRLAKLEDLRTILSSLIAYIDSTITEENFQNTLRNPIPIEAYDTFRKTVEIVNKLNNKTKKKKATMVFHTLFLHLGLQLFGDTKLADESIKELFSCYEHMKHKKEVKEEAQEGDDPLWIEVVVDLFLNLLSHNSHLLRSLIKCVFPHLCGHMTPTAVHQILAVLDPKNDSNPLTKRGRDDSDDSEDDEEKGEEPENEEVETKDDDSEEEDSDSEDDVDEDEFDGNETQNDKLRQALRQALGGEGYQTDEESIDIDDLSESEAERLDGALGQAFKQFKPNLGRRNKQSKDEETLTHFRVRVLDLIEIYLESNPTMILALEIMLPLLQTLEYTVREKYQQPLQERVSSCLKKLSNLKKFSSVDDVSESTLCDLLRSILDKGTKTQSIVQDMDQPIADCCIFVLRCSQVLISSEEFPKKSKKKLSNELVEIFTESLESFFNKRESLIPFVLLKEMLQITWIGSNKLASKIVEISFNEEIRIFKRCQSLTLLKIFFSNNRLLQAVKENEKDLSIFTETISNLNQNTTNFFTNVNEGKDVQSTEKFVSNLLLALAALKKSPFKEETNLLDYETLGNLVRSYRSKNKLSKDASTAYKTFCKALGIPVAVTMQAIVNKAATDTSPVLTKKEKKEKKKEKKKLNKEKLKLKKEAKLARMKIGSENLSGSFSFVNANLVEMKDVEDKVEDETSNAEESSENTQQTAKKSKSKKRKPLDNADDGDVQQVKKKKKKTKQT